MTPQQSTTFVTVCKYPDTWKWLKKIHHETNWQEQQKNKADYKTASLLTWVRNLRC